MKSKNSPLQSIFNNITPIKPSNKVVHKKKPPKIRIHEPIQEKTTEDVYFGMPTENRIASDESLFYAHPSINTRMIRQLKRGDFPIEGRCDLHGLTLEQAHDTIVSFLQRSQTYEKKYLLIIHGKGRLTPNEPPKLKNLTHHILSSHAGVLAFCSALPKDGGVGAVYVRISRAS